MTRQNIHLAMFYFSEEPNCRKNKQVVSRLGRRSNISGIPTYQTFDLQWTCQSPIRQCVLKTQQRLLNRPSPPPCPPRRASLCSRNQQAGLKHRTLHPCRRARQHVKGNPAPIKSLLPRWKERRRERGKWQERMHAEFLPPVSLPLPSKSKVTIFLPGKKKKKRYPAIATTSELSQPYSNGNAQLKKKKNESDQKCRCLKYVHGITIFASNYNYENGWKYIVSICMENNCREREGSMICAWHWNV